MVGPYRVTRSCGCIGMCCVCIGMCCVCIGMCCVCIGMCCVCVYLACVCIGMCCVCVSLGWVDGMCMLWLYHVSVSCECVLLNKTHSQETLVYTHKIHSHISIVYAMSLFSLYLVSVYVVRGYMVCVCCDGMISVNTMCILWVYPVTKLCVSICYGHATHTQNPRSLLQKSPTKKTIFCKKHL